MHPTGNLQKKEIQVDNRQENIHKNQTNTNFLLFCLFLLLDCEKLKGLMLHTEEEVTDIL